MGRPRSVGIVLCMAVFGLLAVSAAGATITTIGQTSASADYICESPPGSPGEIDFQSGVASGASFVVPAGPWLLTSWSTFAGTPGGSMALLVLRATAVPGAYVIVAKSPAQQLTAGQMNTFSVSFAVRGGDFLGLWSRGAACATHTQDFADLNPYQGSSPEPAVGDTVTPTLFHGYLQNISATITNSADQCKNGGWQSFGVFKNQGDCVSWLATGGKNPPAKP